MSVRGVVILRLVGIKLKAKQYCRRFTDGILKYIFLNETLCNLIQLSLKFVHRSSINNEPPLVEIMWDNGLVPSRWHAIVLTFDGLVYWRAAETPVKFRRETHISRLRDFARSGVTTVWLSHWGRLSHIRKITIIGSDNGLSPGRHQAIIWTNAGLLSIELLGTNFNEIGIKIQPFSYKKISLKASSAKWRPFYIGLNVLIEFQNPFNAAITFRADSRCAPSQWETSLQSNAVSHWPGASLEHLFASLPAHSLTTISI